MNEFLNALLITLALVLGGYLLFGSLSEPQSGTGTMDMSIGGMSIPAESMESMSGMKH